MNKLFLSLAAGLTACATTCPDEPPACLDGPSLCALVDAAGCPGDVVYDACVAALPSIEQHCGALYDDVACCAASVQQTVCSPTGVVLVGCEQEAAQLDHCVQSNLGGL